MILNKSDLCEYMKYDKLAMGIKYNHPRFMTDFEWRYLICLRKAEYFYNTNRLIKYLFMFKLRRLQLKYNTFIPMNVFGKGLSIAHIGGIRVNSQAHVGEFCRIQEGVTIGATDGLREAPQIGNYVYIGSGAKIIGNITIVDSIQIGAGAVVVNSINEKGTYAGVPAKKISNNSSEKNLLYIRK